MLQRCLHFPSITAVLCLVLAPLASRGVESASAAQTQVVQHEISGLGNDAVPMDGNWEFHLGDDPAWASPSFDDSQWKKITADQPWGAQAYDSYHGFAWYRYHLTVNRNPATPKDLALLLAQVDDCYELYWNGILIGRNGKLPPNPTWYTSQPPQTYGLGPIQSGVLAVRVWKSPLASNDPGTVGGFEAMPLIGTPEGIANRKAALDLKWLRGAQFQFGLNSFYALIAVLAFASWLRSRKQWMLLAMSGYTGMQVVSFLLGGLLIKFPFAVTVGLLQPVLMIQDISQWFLIFWLLRLDESPRLRRVMKIWVYVFVVAFSLDGIVTMFWGGPNATTMQVLDAILTLIFTPLEVLPVVLVITAIVLRKRLDSASIVVAVCAFIAEMLFVVRNAATQFVRFTHWTLADTINAPLFRVNGMSFNARTIAGAMLLLSIVYAVYRYSVENRRQQAALEQEIQNAREIQQVLIPETLPKVPGFTVTSAYRPAQQVGGDFFQIISLEGGSTLVVLGDVSGKGLKAAMAVSLIVGALRALADDYPGPAELLTQLNRRLFGRLQGGFATCLILLLRPDGSCVVASAGHPAPFLNKLEIDLPGALPLGVSQATLYLQKEVAVRPGDHFSLYTDGLLEARRPSGELYGFQRIEDLFATQINAETATAAAVNFGQDDDITVLTLTRTVLGDESVDLQMAPSLHI